VAAPRIDAGSGVAAHVYRLSTRDFEIEPLATRSESPGFEQLVRTVMHGARTANEQKLFDGPALAGTLSKKVFTNRRVPAVREAEDGGVGRHDVEANALGDPATTRCRHDEAEARIVASHAVDWSRDRKRLSASFRSRARPMRMASTWVSSS
jgi:hypothetical protein